MLTPGTAVMLRFGDQYGDHEIGPLTVRLVRTVEGFTCDHERVTARGVAGEWEADARYFTPYTGPAPAPRLDA